jgi:hypothetical protein
MAYQPNVIAEFNRALRDTNASPKVKKALFEAGIVESGLKNLSYGDRDSLGPLQQRPSQGWRNARNPYMAARDFIKQAQPLAQKYGTAGALAQAVQRSAFPGRYDQQSGAASSILKGSPRGAGGALPQQTSVPVRAGGGVDPRQQIALSLLGLGSLGGSYGDAGDSLTNSLIAAAQAQQVRSQGQSSYGAPTRATTGGITGGAISRQHLGRIDQGVDFTGAGPVPAHGDAVVTRVVRRGGPSGWPGGGFVVYKLTSGPARGRYVYVAENIDPKVRVGQRLKAGQTVATALGSSPFLETGWAANAQGQTLARTRGHADLHPNRANTPEGNDFLRFLRLR